MVELAKTVSFNLYMVDYRGYGKSSVKARHRDFFTDTLKTYAYLYSLKPKKIIIWGESLGGLAGINIAEKRNVEKLILFNSFCDMKDVISQGRKDFLGKTATFLSKIYSRHLNVKESVKKLFNTPNSPQTFFLHS